MTSNFLCALKSRLSGQISFPHLHGDTQKGRYANLNHMGHFKTDSDRTFTNSIWYMTWRKWWYFYRMFQHEGGIDYRVNSRKFISHNNASDLAFPISSHRPFPSEADVKMAFSFNVPLVIISLKESNDSVLKAFQIRKEAIYLEEIEVI